MSDHTTGILYFSPDPQSPGARIFLVTGFFYMDINANNFCIRSSSAVIGIYEGMIICADANDKGIPLSKVTYA